MMSFKLPHLSNVVVSINILIEDRTYCQHFPSTFINFLDDSFEHMLKHYHADQYTLYKKFVLDNELSFTSALQRANPELDSQFTTSTAYAFVRFQYRQHHPMSPLLLSPSPPPRNPLPLSNQLSSLQLSPILESSSSSSQQHPEVVIVDNDDNIDLDFNDNNILDYVPVPPQLRPEDDEPIFKLKPRAVSKRKKAESVKKTNKTKKVKIKPIIKSHGDDDDDEDEDEQSHSSAAIELANILSNSSSSSSSSSESSSSSSSSSSSIASSLDNSQDNVRKLVDRVLLLIKTCQKQNIRSFHNITLQERILYYTALIDAIRGGDSNVSADMYNYWNGSKFKEKSSMLGFIVRKFAAPKHYYSKYNTYREQKQLDELHLYGPSTKFEGYEYTLSDVLFPKKPSHGMTYDIPFTSTIYDAQQFNLRELFTILYYQSDVNAKRKDIDIRKMIRSFQLELRQCIMKYVDLYPTRYYTEQGKERMYRVRMFTEFIRYLTFEGLYPSILSYEDRRTIAVFMKDQLLTNIKYCHVLRKYENCEHEECVRRSHSVDERHMKMSLVACCLILNTEPVIPAWITRYYNTIMRRTGVIDNSDIKTLKDFEHTGHLYKVNMDGGVPYLWEWEVDLTFAWFLALYQRKHSELSSYSSSSFSSFLSSSSSSESESSSSPVKSKSKEYLVDLDITKEVRTGSGPSAKESVIHVNNHSSSSSLSQQ